MNVPYENRRSDAATTVVVTGLGATTPLGGDVDSTWDGLLNGRSGVRSLTEDWAESLPVRFAARAAVDPLEVLERVEARKLDRSAQLALIAAREAWRDAGFEPVGDPSIEPTRLGVTIGTGIGGLTTLLSAYDTLREKGPRRVSPHTVPMLMPNSPSAHVSLAFKARAGAHTVASACATGAESIARGLDLIRGGFADVVIAGGTEAVIHPLPMAAFANMMAMSKRNDAPERASRPFDVNRDGFVLGEGSGVLILETAAHAAARGARVYAELAGAGLTSDAHDIVSPDGEGHGIARAIAAALAASQIDPAEFVHVNAHATSTPQGDLAELRGLRAVLGAHAEHLAISATKSMTGHLLGGAGAVESVALVKALSERVAPPTINVDELDPDVDLDIVLDKPRELPDGPIAGLKNAIGFGGHNAVLAFRVDA
jgi:3-oxoacyl-[acyl-carrier-protein] synthase II